MSTYITDIVAEFYSSVESEYERLTSITLAKVDVNIKNVDCLQGYIVGSHVDFLTQSFGNIDTHQAIEDLDNIITHLEIVSNMTVLPISHIDYDVNDRVFYVDDWINNNNHYYIIEVRDSGDNVIVILGKFGNKRL